MGLQNNAKRWARISIIIMLIGIVMIVLGITADQYDFYWMIFVGALLFITFLICLFMFLSQATRLDRMFSGIDLFAHWTFEENSRQEKAQEEYIQRKSQNKIMLLVITGFFLVISIPFVIFAFDDTDDALVFILIMVSVLAVISLFALLAPGIRYRKMKTAVPEVFIGPFSAWVMGEYVQWKAPMTKITNVQFVRDKQDNSTIVVNYIIWQRYGPQPHTCRIPVPYDRDLEAQTIAQDIASKNNVKYTSNIE